MTLLMTGFIHNWGCNMVAIRYTCKDLIICKSGETLDIAKAKIVEELAWFNEMFPRMKYPKTPRKFMVTYS